MTIFLAVLFIILFLASIALNFLSLPGNWGIIILLAIWTGAGLGTGVSWEFFAYMTAIVIVAEISEFIIQMYGAKKFGSSKKGNLGGIIGAIVGAILGAPILFGLGAVFGALAGAFIGCFTFEKINNRSNEEAIKASWGAFWGKFFGMSIKIGLGVVVLILSVPRVWP